jgi:hypothetical protein
VAMCSCDGPISPKGFFHECSKRTLRFSDLHEILDLSKWLFKLINEDGLWQQLLRNKYIKDKPIGCCNKKAIDSHFWKSIMKVKDAFLVLGSFKVKDVSLTRFWGDIWLGDKPLKDRFLALFNIVRRKQDSVAKVLGSIPLNISF